MLVVAHLVVGDAAGQVAQHRLVAGLLQGTVVGGRAGFHHAARGHLQRVRSLEIVDRAGLAVFVEEALVAARPVEFRPDVLHVAAQRETVLQFLGFPVPGEPRGGLRHMGVVDGEVARVGVGAAFDKGCRGEQIEQRAVVAHLLRVDGRVVDVGHGPGQVVPFRGRWGCGHARISRQIATCRRRVTAG
ncbi:hypothetical protein D3C72_1465130 [compost metagenome]